MQPRFTSSARVASSAPFLLVLTALFWGGHWVVARAVITESSPFALSFWRWATAALFFAPFAWKYLARDAAALRAQWKSIALLSLTGTGLYNGLGYIGVQHTTATNALLIQSVTPALIPLFGFLLVRDRIGPAAIAGVAVSCAGVLAIASKLDLQALLALELNRGDLWLLVNVAMWALYTVCLRWKPVGLHPFSFLFAIMCAGVLQLVPFYAFELATGGGVRAGTGAVLGILYLGIFPALINYLMWNRAVGEIGAARAGPYLYLVPVFGTAMAHFFLGERLFLYHFVGIALIFGGIWLASKDKRGSP
ncbi:MAG: DMT family transporter [Proteobacteria bacterium]|nr:DMT family transporter [Pseudomonadota bacterium]